ncbi:aliphatic sulfonate ABC transporter substrate-binding protein [Amycolatopsis eburnea]|uniref:Aliphatic sulfonate ABC transporter substrate-binding protein n=1 Tax=Amycolatopsis eburnea TaxID=2267691 RepID=A0A3R9DZY1_9PSEU|nr:aliphatic sulfonate ABC transporter substrate-binding protein [Amycolatopsis eburnea]RSD12006.1 aliphatic sulfonate ABC transporter substrate-binding protein [Amycolatopsis eburnea]
MTLSRRTFLTAAGLTALAAPLAACATGSAGGATPGKVRLTYSTISVPKSRGVLEKTLKDQGIAVEWVGPFPNHAPTLQAVVGGTADFSFGGSTTPADQAILSGADLVYVAWAASTPRTTAIVAGAHTGIEKVTDLAGKTVAVNKAGLGEFLLVAALEKYNVPRESVKITYLNPPEASAAFGAGKIDAWAIWQGFREIAEVQYGAKPIFVDGDELDFQIDFTSFLVRREYAEQNADTIRKVIAAFQADYEWQNQHYKEALDIGNAVSHYPQAVLDKMAAKNVQTKLALINDDGIAQLQRGADWLTQRKILSGPITIADHAVKL